LTDTREHGETSKAAGDPGANSLMRSLHESKVLYALFLIVVLLGALTPFLWARVPVPGLMVAVMIVISLHLGSVKRSP